jgi:hypothetical protein
MLQYKMLLHSFASHQFNIVGLALKKSKYHIICSWLLLICFITGQAALYAHQHGVNTPVSKSAHQSSRQTVTEKCQLCDAMHFNSMVLNQQVYVKPVVLNSYIFIPGSYNFVSLSLILYSGRAPPLS